MDVDDDGVGGGFMAVLLCNIVALMSCRTLLAVGVTDFVLTLLRMVDVFVE